MARFLEKHAVNAFRGEIAIQNNRPKKRLKKLSKMKGANAINTLGLYKYSDTELKELMKRLTILIDTREKENGHITGYFDMKKIPYIKQALSYGDYSYMLPALPEFGITRDLYFNNMLAIERKANLEELSGNLAQKREQFENEFLRAKDCKLILMVESGSLADIYWHKYKTNLSEKSFIGSVMAWQHRYSISVSFIDLGNAGAFIYQNCYYQLREYLKGV